MRRSFAVAIASLLFASPAHAQTPGTLFQLQQWTVTSTPSSSLTQTQFGKPIKITGLTTGLCLTLDSNKILTTTACGSSNSGNVSTSTVPNIGDLSYWTGNGTPSTLGTVGTSTVTINGPFSIPSTLGNLVGGSNTTIMYYGLATSSALAQGQALYATSASGVASVATTTLSFSGFPARLSGTIGALLGGANATLTYWGLATTSQPASSNVLVSNGSSGVYGAATTTASCSGTVSCSQFTILGSSPVTLTGSASATGLSTTTPWTKGQVAYVNSDSAVTSVATTTLTISGPFVVPSTQGFLVGGSNSSITYTGLATTSQPASSNLLVSNGGTGVYGVATSSATINSPLSGTIVGIGSGLSLSLGTVGVGNGGTGLTSVADGALLFGGVGGGSANLVALATTSNAGRFLMQAFATGRPAWTATSSLGVALSDTVGTLAANRGGTGQSAYTAGDILYADTTSTLKRVASSTDGFVLTLSSGAPAWVATTTLSTITGTLGVSKGGTGDTTFSGGQLIYGNGTNALSSVSTTSVSAGTGVTLNGTAGALVGGSNLTINTPWAVSTNIISSSTASAVGIGTSSPYALLTAVGGADYLSHAASTLFLIASSSAGSATSTLFTVQSTGNVGVSTTSPWRTLSVAGTVAFPNLTTGTGAGSLCLSASGEVLFSSAANCVAGSGITAIGPTGQTQSGATITLATSSTAFNGLTASTTIAGSANTLTFTNTLAGLLGVGGGGTGNASVADGALLFGGVGGGTAALTALATSTAGKVLQLDLSTGRPSWVATSSLKIDFANITGVVPVAQGGTNITSYTPGDIIYASGATSFARVASSTDGRVLALANGAPSWVATTTLSTITGTLGVSKGGTGDTTFSGGQLIYGNGTNALSSVGTSTHSFSGPFTISGTLGALVGGSNSTVTWNGLATTSALTQGQLLYNTTGGNGVASVATTSVTCAGTASCSSFTAIGGSPVTITGAGGGSTVTVTFASSTAANPADGTYAIPNANGISVVNGDVIEWWVRVHKSTNCNNLNLVAATIKQSTMAATSSGQNQVHFTSALAGECGATTFGYFQATTTETVYPGLSQTTPTTAPDGVSVMAQKIH